MPLLLAVIAHSIRFRASLRLLRRRSNFLVALLEVALLRFALFLETGGLVDHQHLVLFPYLYLSRFQHGEEFR